MRSGATRRVENIAPVHSLLRRLLAASTFLDPGNGFLAITEFASFRLCDAFFDSRPYCCKPCISEFIFPLKKPKTGADDLGRRPVMSALDLAPNELLKLFGQ